MIKACNKCKLLKEDTDFRSGRKVCRVCCNKEYSEWCKRGGNILVNRNNLRYYNKNKDTVDYRYLRLKTGAKQRNKELNITLEQFKKLWELPCKYCGDEVTTAGLDRVDSSRGYTMDNIVRCCEKCNRAKNNMSVKDFIIHCRKIVYTHDSNSSPKSNS